jgi:hypothetical protein
MARVCSQEELARVSSGGRAVFSVQAVPFLTHRIYDTTSAASVQLVLRRMSSGGTRIYLEIIDFLMIFANIFK